jgi:hypothetical protein
MSRVGAIEIRYLLLWRLLILTGCRPVKQHMVVVPPSPANPNNWEIREPIVNARLTPLSDVTYQPGDVVTITQADGCVNTGGSGRTWKNYKSPQGDDAGRLYHGLVWIPGATENGAYVPVATAPMRIDGVLGHSYVISDKGWKKEQLHVYIGYEDDFYKDNGYYKDSAGATDEQCEPVRDSAGRWRIPRARVQIRIEHGPVATKNIAPLAFDLLATDVDPNQLLKNPLWSAQRDSTLTGEEPDSSHLPNADVQCGSFPSVPGERTPCGETCVASVTINPAPARCA